MQLGVIADDFTGATDIASFLVRNGADGATEWRADPRSSADQRGGGHQPENSLLPGGNGRQPVAGGLRWLQAQGCQQFYFKYCSTFDSTAQGNIGPVLDALLAELGETRTVIPRRCRLTAARSIRDICSSVSNC